MTRLVEIEIGSDGIRYVQECLAQGTGLLEKLSLLPLESGKAFAVVPSGTSVARALSFEAGGIMKSRDANGWLTDRLQNLWSDIPVGTCIFQDTWANPSDRTTIRHYQRRLVGEENVYFYSRRSDLDSATVENMRRALSSFLIAGVFTSFDLGPERTAPGYIAKSQDLAAIADSTREIFVSAYDQEGFVIWRR